MATTASTVQAAVSTGTGRQVFVDTPLGRTSAMVGIPLNSLYAVTGVVPSVTPGAGTMNLVVSTNAIFMQGVSCDNTTKTDVVFGQVRLPHQYQDGTSVTVRIPCAILKTGGGTNNGSTVDLSVYEHASGAVGSDLVTTAAQTFTALDTWYDKDFVVAGAGLVAGDILTLKITSNVVDSEAGGGTLIFTMDSPALLLTLNG